MRFFLLCIMLVSACDRKSTSSTEQRALSRTVNELLLPWHERFLTQTKLLQESAERFCQNPGNSGEFSATRDAWRQAVLAWQSVNVINFGPLAEQNQTLHLQPWPDSLNVIPGHVEAILAEDTPLTGANLAQIMLLEQGLSAIEYVLFDPARGHLETYHDPRACQFLRVVSSNTHDAAQALADAWQPRGDNYVGTLISPGPSNAAFPEIGDSLTIILDALISTLESLKEHKIGGPADEQPDTNPPSELKPEYWRSQFSLAAMKQELRSARQLVARALTPVLKARGHGALADKIERSLRGAEDHLNRMSEPLFGALPVQRSPERQQVWQHLEQALAMLKTDVPPVLRTQ